jgi:16S rRNA (cytosine967-C5)-methyltransferase
VSDAVTDESVGEMGPAAVPVDARYRLLARPLLPDPRSDLAAYLSAAFSWPGWLAERWLHQHGPDECVRLGFWFNSPPPLWIRVNTTKLIRDVYLTKLAAANIPAEPGDHPQAIKLPDGGRVPDLPGFAAGEFAVQDHSSMLVASALAPKPGWQVLDLCSAPGGKTTHLAELMHHSGRIVACDIIAKRLDSVADLCRRMGVRIVEPRLLKDGTDAPFGPFDAAVVDVPCSNTGVLGRRPEVRWRLQPHEFEHLIRLQRSLLTTALNRVKPGGVVVYSTCSIDPDENGGVVRAVLNEMKGVKLEAEHTSIPGRPSDGGYWARLKR